MICEACEVEFVHRAETFAPKYRRAHRFCSQRCKDAFLEQLVHELAMGLNEIRFVGNRFAKDIAGRVLAMNLP